MFDALTSERPYKSAFSAEKSLEIIAEQRGSILTPRLSTPFVRGWTRSSPCTTSSATQRKRRSGGGSRRVGQQRRRLVDAGPRRVGSVGQLHGMTAPCAGGEPRILLGRSKQTRQHNRLWFPGNTQRANVSNHYAKAPGRRQRPGARGSATPTADAESSSPIPSGVERRKQPRRAYPFVQMIAPIMGGNLPAEKDFRPMHCRNISTGGLAFLSPTLPTTDSYVVALGSPPPRVTYVVCRVIHVPPLTQAQTARMRSAARSSVGLPTRIDPNTCSCPACVTG